MKLKNKKTGEIKEVIVDGHPVSGETIMLECAEMDANEESGYKLLGRYTTLAELNEEWEDYEEPKEYWYIDYEGGIMLGETDNSPAEKMMISIGNHFNTLSEAEKAVEKLKAWKRLKDKGFRFNGVYDDYTIKFTAPKEEIGWFWCNGMDKDLDLLFGGEE